MPVAVTDLPAHSDPPRKLWTRSQFDELYSSGLLNGQRLELIEGELIDKMGKKRPHVISLTLLLGWLQEVFGAHLVNTEAPIDVAPEDNPTNEPEPELIVLTQDQSHFRKENPRPEDLQLVVGVHRDPQAGRYLAVAAYGEEESVVPLAAPDSCLRIRDAFPD